MHPKLSAHFYGPFQIEAQIGSVAYRPKLPEGSQVHPVFHVFLLKKALGVQQQPRLLLVGLEVDLPPTVILNKVLAFRDLLHDGLTSRQALVQWLDQTSDDATWEDV